MMTMPLSAEIIADSNASQADALNDDYAALGRKLERSGVPIDAVLDKVKRFSVAVPSWGAGRAGTRFAKFPLAGEPTAIHEKLEDCAVINQLGRTTPRVSPHFPWDCVDDCGALRAEAESYGLGFDAVNSNTFQDQPGQAQTYATGSLSSTLEATRQQAIEHNIACIEIGQQLGSKTLAALARRVVMGGTVLAAAMVASPAAAAECGDLARMALPGGEVTSAALVAPGAFQQPAAPGGPPPGVGGGVYRDLPEFCRVQATLRPTSDSAIKVEVWLPNSGWNGKFVGVGNGIWAGQLSYSDLSDPLKRGYAVATTDTGHTGSGLTAEWAIGHPEKLVDFGHRAVHEMTVTAKRAIGAFYGRAPSLSLWNSCSTGGRQGLMAAHRYPEDYDAISAMAPANPMTDLMAQSMWAGWQPNRSPGAMVSMPQMAAVHRAAVAQCDKHDGLVDGLIGRPGDCRFDPAGVEGLTDAQAETLRAIYRGPPGLPGWPVGSELQLSALTQDPEPFPVALTYYSMLVFGGQPDWDWKNFDYQRDTQRGREHGAGILDVPPDGLGAFFARGGKILMSHGWSDGLIPATNALKFHDALLPTLTDAQAESQYRLFMAPGMDHCAGGEGPSQFDTLGVIDEWATTGKAPERIIATRPTTTEGMPGAPAAPPLAPMSRPLCAWPKYARYKGSGNPNEAASFVCASAHMVAPDER